MNNGETKIHKGKPRYLSKQSSSFECYIENKSLAANQKGRRIPLITSPSSVSDNIGANFNQQAIPGGSAPAITYSGTGARTVSIDFFVPKDYLPPNTDFNNTEEYLNALRALVYPRYHEARIEPPNCILHLTNLVIDGVCTQCNINYKLDQAYGNDGALGADVSLSFMEVLDKALNNYEVSGRTTILNSTRVGFVEESAITNGTYREPRTQFSWDSFRIKGSTSVRCNFKKLRTNIPEENSQYVPNYSEEGYGIGAGDYTIVKFYYASPVPLTFSGLDIKGEGNETSMLFKICIDGESYNDSSKVLNRNYIPELTKKQINEETSGANTMYYYYIYVPCNGLNSYIFDRALIRTVICSGGIS